MTAYQKAPDANRLAALWRKASTASEELLNPPPTPVCRSCEAFLRFPQLNAEAGRWKRNTSQGRTGKCAGGVGEAHEPLIHTRALYAGFDRVFVWG